MSKATDAALKRLDEARAKAERAYYDKKDEAARRRTFDTEDQATNQADLNNRFPAMKGGY